MDEVLLERFAYSPFGVFGRILIPEFECFTVERPWLDNKPRQSCIPEGEYDLRLGTYNRGGYPAYEVLDVPDRTLIKIHVGNTIDDVVGCIAPGKSLAYMERKWAVSSSKKAFGEFMEAMAGIEQTRIRIVHYSP
ncbi:DUF5675 family protein [Aestuariirhabdus sp. Z084]|uniref:DUF5675 family protein n=1 Tax=Aestuariirhabdus haliotis TaxID=2918751 RepID=UPI00201B36C1|nr:DUF5675 family protein [Aestuariirhabdus haliotis]MCL6416146.1 DUF5675 family protein [Aestuariirhabdus haliotis]MCL6420097.1 DUF5675 family protein [Aestuariirhabdus haliotis]